MAREGKVPPRVFKRSFFSPLPKESRHMRCYGKGHKQKCYRVDERTGKVLGRDQDNMLWVVKAKGGKHLRFDRFGRRGDKERVHIQTPVGLAMSKKGFQSPEYNDVMNKWKPKKSKRIKVPAGVVFAELHYQLAAEDMAEAEADSEDAVEVEGEVEADKPRKFKARKSPYPTTKLTSKPTIIAKGKEKFFTPKYRLPQFTNSKIEDAATQFKHRKHFQTAAVHPPSFFRPRKEHSRHRFAEVNSEDAEVVAGADSIELSAVPTMNDLPTLKLQASSQAAIANLAVEEQALNTAIDQNVAEAEQAETKAAIGTFFSEVKSLLSSKVARF